MKIKGDKDWNALNLNQAKAVDELHQNFKDALEKVFYYQSNIVWLQSRFPEAKYADVVGLCKVADKTEYAEEQHYSLNSGRYVGVYIEEDKLTKEEFKIKLNAFRSKLSELNEVATSLMSKIESTEIC